MTYVEEREAKGSFGGQKRHGGEEKERLKKLYILFVNR